MSLMEMFDHLPEIDRRSEDRIPEYGIQSKLTKQWVGLNFKWVSRQQAQRFHSMTGAIGYATMVLDLDTKAYEIKEI